MTTHEEHESRPWTVNIGAHPQRTESKAFRDAKRTAKKILATIPHDQWPYGYTPNVEMHHGGSQWVYEQKTGWHLELALAGIEWSMMFAADPVKVERLRQDTVRRLEKYIDTRVQLGGMAYDHARIDRTIVNADDVAWYCDSLFNSCVPLGRADHQGIPPNGYGFHHFPAPIKAADFFKRDDFVLWVTLPDGSTAAVAPVSPPGSGDGRARVLYARLGTQIGDSVAEAAEQGKAVVVPADHPIARAAFARQ